MHTAHIFEHVVSACQDTALLPDDAVFDTKELPISPSIWEPQNRVVQRNVEKYGHLRVVGE